MFISKKDGKEINIIKESRFYGFIIEDNEKFISKSEVIDTSDWFPLGVIHFEKITVGKFKYIGSDNRVLIKQFNGATKFNKLIYSNVKFWNGLEGEAGYQYNGSFGTDFIKDFQFKIKTT